MNWSDTFVTGIDIVDTQHRGLVALINQAAEAMVEQEHVDLEVAAPILNELTAYVVYHFSTEEDLMSSHALDKRHQENHHKAHSDFAAHVTALRKDIEAGEGVGGHELLRFLSNWLAFHILGDDQRMAREIHAVKAGTSPEEAFEMTEGSKAEILRGANDVLVNALVELFAQLSEQNRQLAIKSENIERARVELDDYRKTLEDQVAQRTAELQNANQELREARDASEAASMSKTRFLGIVSHELLTPLNVILGFANLLEGAAIPDKQRDQARRIVRAASNLNQLLQEVLYYSRLDAGEVNIRHDKLQLASLLAHAADKVSAIAREKGLELNVVANPNLPVVYGDERHLLHAVETLVENALKFTERGSVSMEARLLEMEGTRARVLIEVRDTGIGIPLESQKDLFRLFEQLDSSSTRRHGGLGLGLAVCARLVHMMDGEVTFSSNPGVGSAFSISLWMDVDQAVQPASTAQQSTAVTMGPYQICAQLDWLEQLLAEDNMQARQIFAELEPSLRELVDWHEVTELAVQIRGYDFVSALDKVHKIIRELKPEAT